MLDPRAVRVVGVGLVTLMVLGARAASAATPPRTQAPDLPILFDTREAEARPIVGVRLFGRPLKLLVDTGSPLTILGPKAAGISRDVVEAGHVQGPDYSGRPIVGVRVPIFDLRLPRGWPSLGDEFLVSDWIDRMNKDLFIDPSAPHFDGVIAPITLAAADRVVVIDFGARSLSVGSWDDAQKHLATGDRALTISPGKVKGGGELVVPAMVQGRPVMLMLDTGAARSLLYVPHDVDLMSILSRRSVLPATLQAGEVDAKVRLDLVEKIEPLLGQETPSLCDGLLGMDVLRSCVVAFDDSRFLVRCRSDEPPPISFDLSSMRSPRPIRSLPLVQAGTEGLPMRQHPDGSYDWTGHHVKAVIHKDGRVTYSKAPERRGGQLDRMDADEERHWFEDQVDGFLTALAKTQERQTILDALDALPRYLGRIPDDPRLTLAQRRHVLFMLWDEMAEADDRERGWAGTEARAIIDKFIRMRLPDGSDNGYSPDELAGFNRMRRNGIRFDPYHPAGRKPERDQLDDH